MLALYALVKFARKGCSGKTDAFNPVNREGS
jgi:hypothetical protein